jgi:hypothetical protein
MGNYSKFIVSIVGLALMLVNQFFGVDLTGYSQDIINAISTVIAVATALGVERIANKPLGSGSSGLLRSPPFVTGAAIAATLAVILFLSGCASVGVGRDATMQQRVDAARSDLNTVGIGMIVYATLPPCGSPGAQGLCSSQRVLALWDAGETSALAGLAAVEKLMKEGKTDEEIAAAWAEALAEVVRMQNLLRNSSG